MRECAPLYIVFSQMIHDWHNDGRDAKNERILEENEDRDFLTSDKNDN